MDIFIRKDAFNRILSGSKTLETRRYRGIFNNISEGMVINFINNDNNITVNVNSIQIYENIDQLLKNIDISKVGDNISINRYKNILDRCYNSFDGHMVTFEFTII